MSTNAASLRTIYGSTLRRLQAQFLNAYSTLPSPALQLKLVFVIERIDDQPRTRNPRLRWRTRFSERHFAFKR